MRIVIHPKYQHLRADLENIEHLFKEKGQEIHRGRNVLRILEISGLRLCVKQYGKMPLRHRLATQFYKNCKAKNAFINPLLLKECGFDIPEPVAFISIRKSLLTTTSYFVCLHSSLRYTMKDQAHLSPTEHEVWLKSFAHYVARLHGKGVLHKDFSAGNILYDYIDGKFRFSLIDTNALKVGRKGVNLERGCANLARLEGDEKFFKTLAQHYAAVRHVDADHCYQLIQKAQQAYCNKPNLEP